MCRDTRTTEQIQGALAAEATLARQIANDPMATRQAKALHDALHAQMDTELTELQDRG
ncbi:MAG: hypothetical protein HOU01_10570 [Streptomycetaceae bacterium]|nr:hypothetical protein [Streptomycetaceae bacterium]